ncbi:MAG: hypothetical protein CL933_18960 [Deltaproteobacteria bacterium]|nr:hypothetical protein [Deltaproteobacteria bacterium]
MRAIRPSIAAQAKDAPGVNWVWAVLGVTMAGNSTWSEPGITSAAGTIQLSVSRLSPSTLNVMSPSALISASDRKPSQGSEGITIPAGIREFVQLSE